MQGTERPCSVLSTHTGHLAQGQVTMKHHPLDLDIIFPIRDAASASFMALKADCLLQAGIIDDRERQQVQSRANSAVTQSAIAKAEPRQAA